ncbi:neutral/alkaline non-lysosomal ceramidase N-terminal domain-containing protein [Streptomyces violascens]|uniref:neutral/alkaline non-lysosomal ceramidase N-terminal domain-containing protein n=1 Tax=Streptomyces violascens TaxID=67381 RepID=UPI0036602182
MAFRAGRGIADITGEAAECGMLGYGRADQQSAGIHTRQRARAFAFEEGGARLLLVVCELPLMSDAVVREVLRRLPDGYGAANVMLTATHTHCGPGGYFHHALYNSNTGGFREQTFRAIADGITEAAHAATADLAPVAAIVGAELSDVLVAGYSNGYIHYVTTPEEYGAQEYEGGSTLFGRWELPALCQTVAGLATAMRDGTPAGPGTPEPAVPVGRRHRRGLDDAPHPGRRFGDVLDFSLIGRRATASFVAAHPSNDLRRGGSYLSVERRGDDGSWTRIADDGDWSTLFRWARSGGATSVATVAWNIPPDTLPGAYRLAYHGDSATKGPFTGVSEPFQVP